jgi:hypothetical protein
MATLIEAWLGGRCVRIDQLSLIGDIRMFNRAKKEYMEELARWAENPPSPPPSPPGVQIQYQFERLCVPVPFADFDFYYIDSSLDWSPNRGQAFQRVTVPRGFCTDLASIPRIFWSLLPRTGRYAYGAIVHDYLYWVQTNTRKEADRIFHTGMRDAGVKRFTAFVMYAAVRIFGASPWRSNASAKEKGEKRILKVFPPHNALTAWGDWKKEPSHFSD